jgi:hypothetical protein
MTCAFNSITREHAVLKSANRDLVFSMCVCGKGFCLSHRSYAHRPKGLHKLMIFLTHADQ